MARTQSSNGGYTSDRDRALAAEMAELQPGPDLDPASGMAADMRRDAYLNMPTEVQEDNPPAPGSRKAGY